MENEMQREDERTNEQTMENNVILILFSQSNRYGMGCQCVFSSNFFLFFSVPFLFVFPSLFFYLCRRSAPIPLFSNFISFALYFTWVCNVFTSLPFLSFTSTCSCSLSLLLLLSFSLSHYDTHRCVHVYIRLSGIYIEMFVFIPF